MTNLKRYAIGFLFGAMVVLAAWSWQQEERQLFKFNDKTAQLEHCKSIVKIK